MILSVVFPVIWSMILLVVLPVIRSMILSVVLPAIGSMIVCRQIWPVMWGIIRSEP